MPVILDFAHEGMELAIPFALDFDDTLSAFSLGRWLCKFSNDLSHFSDVGMIMDSILTKGRRATNADAGTIYMVEEGKLVFSFTQNASFSTAEESLRQVYQGTAVPVDTSSIVGYVSTTRRPLAIDNVRAILSDCPYSFNDPFDTASGYVAVSLLVVALVVKNELVGVMQLINRLSPEGKAIPFSTDCEVRIGCLSITLDCFLMQK